MRPLTVVVSGLPASGKSTLAQRLAAAQGWTLHDKDACLERLFGEQGVGDSTWRQSLSRQADEMLWRDAKACRGSQLLVSWWCHPRAVDTTSGTPLDGALRDMGKVVELHVRCDPALAVERFFARSRHLGHLDGARDRAVERRRFEQWSAQGALGIGPLVEVTAEQVRTCDVEALAAALQRANGAR